MKEYDYNISVMKIIFSFCVILCHYWRAIETEKYSVALMMRMRGVAVPIFFIISFLLTRNIYENSDLQVLKKRIKRLLIPYLMWPIIYYWGYLFLDLILKKLGRSEGMELSFSIKNLIWQLLFGSEISLCPQFWYQFDLIVFTIIIWIMFRINPKIVKKMLIFLSIVALWMQYSGTSARIFGNLPSNIKFSIGRLPEICPFITMGLLISTKWLDELRRKWKEVIVILLSILYLIGNYDLFEKGDDFGYGGLWIFSYSICIFLIIYILPFWETKQIIKSCIRFLGKYSFGVFCLHYAVGYCWNLLICDYYQLDKWTFTGCIVIYSISVGVSWAVNLIPNNIVRMLVQ